MVSGNINLICISYDAIRREIFLEMLPPPPSPVPVHLSPSTKHLHKLILSVLWTCRVNMLMLLCLSSSRYSDRILLNNSKTGSCCNIHSKILRMREFLYFSNYHFLRSLLLLSTLLFGAYSLKLLFCSNT